MTRSTESRTGLLWLTETCGRLFCEPYRFTRNPQYLGVLRFLTGHFLWTGALRLRPYSAMVAAAFQSFIVFYEEPHLEKRFGETYRRYRRQIPRWWKCESDK